MTEIGELRTEKPIEQATREIRHWLEMLKVNGLDINMNWDARQNIALLKFKYNGKSYEFRSQKQKNCRLNMWAIARVMEYKIRSHLMRIEEFDKSMVAYLALENHSSFQSPSSTILADDRNYVVLGVSPLASNDEVATAYKRMCKAFHPDTTLNEFAKKEAEKRIAEINVAYGEIKKERGM